MTLRLGLLAIGVLAATPSLAQSTCEQFAWSVNRERAVFTSASMPVVQSGAASVDPAAATLALLPSGDIKFPVVPEKASRPDMFGGFVRVLIPSTGLYQVTLSDDAWIDVSQDERVMLKATAHSGRKDCPGIRKSVRFDLKVGPALIQVSNSPVPMIKLAVIAAQP